jgi:hypothetical protein
VTPAFAVIKPELVNAAEVVVPERVAVPATVRV